jgi:ketosteroid isomerase-like protein
MARNVDLARRLYEAHQARDMDAVVALCAPDLEIHALIARLEGIEFRGASAYSDFREFIDATWDDLETALERVSELDSERVMVAIHVRARSRGSEVPIDQQVVWVMTWRDGRLAYVSVHSSAPAALDEADEAPPREVKRSR